MSVYLISDEHYCHEKILQYCSRPFRDTKEMRAIITARHNEVVKKDDTVYHLGDVFFGSNWKELFDIIKKLNGRHHLILGNHDHLHWTNYLEAGFASVHSSLQLEEYRLVHDPAVAGVFTGNKYIHGHTHGLSKRLAFNTYCVCVELHNYTPVNFEEIKHEF